MKRILALVGFALASLVHAQQIPLSGSIGVPGSASVLGYQSIAMTDANRTLTSTEWAHQFLNVTSSVSLTATRSIILPLNQGQQYTIENATTGGQSILAIGASGSGVTIANGSTVVVASDGTNYLQTSSSGGGGGASLPTNAIVYGLSSTTSRAVTSNDIVNTVTPSANVNTGNQQLQSDSTVSSIIASAYCFGDSISQGTASVVGGWITYFNADYGISCNNQAVAGNNVQDETWHIFSSLNPGDSGNPIVASMIGTNNTGFTSGYQAVHLAGHAWAALSSTNKILAGNVLVTATGSQTTDTTFAFANGKTCSSGTCTLTYTANVGSPQFFYVWYKEVSSGANFSVTVDGSTVTDTVTGSNSISTSWSLAPNAEPTTVGLARFPASNTGAASSHVIVVTFQAGATIIGFGFPPTNRYRGITSPRVFMAGVPPQYLNANTTANLAVNALNLADSKILTGDGLYTPFVDVNANLDPVNDFYGCTFTGSISGTTLTVTLIGACPALQIGSNVFKLSDFAPASGVITAFGTGTGGTGTYTMSVSQTVSSQNMVAGPLNYTGSLAVGLHPNSGGDRRIAQLFESVINASPVVATGNLPGPLYVTTPAATGIAGFQQFIPHGYTDTLISGFSQCSGIRCGSKEYSGPRTFGFGQFVDATHEIGVGFISGGLSSEDDISWPIWFTSDGITHTGGLSIGGATAITDQSTLAIISPNTTTCSGTCAISANQNYYKITLTADSTLTFSTPLKAGFTSMVAICQDGTGGHSLALAGGTSILNWPAELIASNTSPNACVAFPMVVDGSLGLIAGNVGVALSVPVSSATGGSGTSGVTCLTAACTNLRGSYSVAGGTFTTGTLLTLAWPSTPSTYVCTASVLNSSTGASIGYHSVATATGITFSALTSATGITVDIDYSCQK